MPRNSIEINPPSQATPLSPHHLRPPRNHLLPHQTPHPLPPFSLSFHHCDIPYISSLSSRIGNPNTYLWNAMIQAFSMSSEPQRSTAFFAKMRQNASKNSLVSAFANCGYVDCARQVFDEITDKSMVSWTAMIDGHVRNERAVEGLGLFIEMRLVGVRVDELTIVSVNSANQSTHHLQLPFFNLTFLHF